MAKGKLCGQHAGFNLQGATTVAANDKKGRENLCKYILRPPLANDRLKIIDDGNVRLEFKRPWSDGTSSIDLAPLALIARLAALVPPPRRHVVRYTGVISSHSSLRSQVVPVCSKCQAPLRLIALIKTEDIAKKILTAMHLPHRHPGASPRAPTTPGRGWWR